MQGQDLVQNLTEEDIEGPLSVCRETPSAAWYCREISKMQGSLTKKQTG
jgi:hypothetical protein